MVVVWGGIGNLGGKLSANVPCDGKPFILCIFGRYRGLIVPPYRAMMSQALNKQSRSFCWQTAMLCVYITSILGCAPRWEDLESPPEIFVAETYDQQTVLRVGVVSNKISKKTAELKPLCDYLALKLAASGITKVESVVASSFDEMVSLFRDNEVHLVLDSFYPTVKLEAFAGAIPLLRAWKDGVPEYSAALFVKADTEIYDLQDLKGRVIAFDDASSTSGYMLPRLMLEEAGLELMQVEHHDNYVAQDRVGYVFSGDDARIMIWVLNRSVDAGAYSFEKLSNLVGSVQEELRVLEQSESVPRYVASVNSSLTPELVSTLRQILLDMELTPEGRSAMHAHSKTARFDRFPQSTDSTFSAVRALLNRFSQESI